jgi:4-hydroxy-tetrahydrodipicolinate synthase
VKHCLITLEEKTMFKGSMVAIVTPMSVNEKIDKKAMQELIEWHIAAGTQGIIVAGTTGESATLCHDEHFELVSLAVKQAASRIPVIAGTGTNSTCSTIKLSGNAKRAGADAALIVTPYYNKPPQNGLYQHYKSIAESVDLPIILYNVPGRTACDILAETVEKLSKIKNIIGIKEASGKLDRAEEIRKRCGKQFAIYSGDDDTAMELMLNGADGVISVTANIAPAKMRELCDAALSGNRTLAEKINDELKLLHKKLFLESNPIPTKWALNVMGKIPSGIRLPLLPLDKRYHEEVKEAMQNAGVSSQ